MKELDENSIDTIITDSPYGLEFMGKDWDTFKKGENIAGGTTGIDTPFGRKQALPAFYQRELSEWHAFQDFNFKWASECLRVLKTGGFMFAMGGTRTHHRLTCGIEDAGFQIRDELCWVYLQGFPKAQDLAGLIDAKMGIPREERPVVGHTKLNPRDKKVYLPNNGWGEAAGDTTYEGTEKPHDQTVRGAVSEQAKLWQGWKTPALKPAFEPIIVAQKPCEGSITENVMAHGVGGFNIDECRITYENEEDKESARFGNDSHSDKPEFTTADTSIAGGWKSRGKNILHSEIGRYPSNVLMTEPCFDGNYPEVIKVAVKPATGHIPRVSKGSQEGHIYSGAWGGMVHNERYFENTSFSKFFIIPKASKGEKEENIRGEETKEWGAYGNGIGNVPKENGKRPTTTTTNPHPTVKPVRLMEHLIKLTTKPNYMVLDPFMGSGTTGVACAKLNRNFIGIEIDEGYFKIAQKRIAEWQNQTRLDIL